MGKNCYEKEKFNYRIIYRWIKYNTNFISNDFFFKKTYLLPCQKMIYLLFLVQEQSVHHHA